MSSSSPFRCNSGVPPRFVFLFLSCLCIIISDGDLREILSAVPVSYHFTNRIMSILFSLPTLSFLWHVHAVLRDMCFLLLQTYSEVKLAYADFTPPSQKHPQQARFSPTRIDSAWNLRANLSLGRCKTPPSIVARLLHKRPLKFGTRKACSSRTRKKIKETAGSC